jgi:choline-glycine betaine transporter
VQVKHWVLLGWALFALSGVFFLIDAIESGDKTALGSAITWIIGVGCFLVVYRGTPEE